MDYTKDITVTITIILILVILYPAPSKHFHHSEMSSLTLREEGVTLDFEVSGTFEIQNTIT